MRIYTSATIIEVTDEEINAISDLISLAEEKDFDYDDFYCLLETISDTKGRSARSFCDNYDNTYTVKRIESRKEI